MTLKGLTILLFVLFTNNTAIVAQTSNLSQPQKKPLSIGDILPDFVLPKMINYKSNTGRTLDFRGKLTILDFWGIRCQACINAMPGLQKLKNEFNNKLNVVLVTRDNETDVKKLLSKSPFAKGTYFPFVLEDNILQNLFPHAIIPHEVWLNEEGRVLAITGHEEVTRENIVALLEKKEIKLPVKKDHVEWSFAKGFWGVVHLDDPDSVKTYHALCVKYIPGIPTATSFKQDSTGLFRGVYFSNNNVVKMYYLAFAKLSIGIMGNLNAKRIISEIKDSSNFMRYTNYHLALGTNDLPFLPKTFPYLTWKSKEEWISDNYFSYDLQLPHRVSDELLRDYIFQDLSRMTPVRAKVEKRLMDAWVIRSSDSSTALLKTKGKRKPIRINDKEGNFGVINLPFSQFARDLNLFWQVDPIVDESNIKVPVDFVINFSDSPLFNPARGFVTNGPLDFDILIEEFNKYGLTLKKEKRLVDMLVLFD